jgi:putative DNA-invertase from lambdoid prophage Rac
VLVYQEQFDFSSSTGKLQLAVFAWAAEFERKRINERTRAGLERARALGKRLGRPRTTVDQEKVRRDYEGLRSERKIARMHGCSRSTVHRILHGSPELIGEIPPKSDTHKKNK